MPIYNFLYKKILAALLAIALTQVAILAEPIGQELRVGAILHLSGEWAREGKAFHEGLELAAQELRAKGKQIQLTVEDSQFVGKVAATAAQKLITQDQVQALIISSLSEAKYSSAQIEARKISAVVLWDAAPELDSLGEYIFGIGAWAPGTGQRAARYAFETLGHRKVATLSNPREWSQSATKYFREEFKRLGGTLVCDEQLAPGESDFRGLALKLRSSGAELLYAPLEDNLVPTFKALWQAKAVAHIMTSDVLSDDFLHTLGPAAEGIYYTQLKNEDSAARSHVAKLYQKTFGHASELLQFNAWGYDALQIILEASTRAKSSDRSLRDTLARTRDYPGASGTISFSEGGSVINYPAVYVVKNGKLEFLVD